MILYTRYSLLILLILTNFTKSKAQEIGAIIDFFGYADNREYKAPHTIDKTFLEPFYLRNYTFSSIKITN